MLATAAHAQTRYVRADAPAGGTGLDWNTAWTELPTTLTRGYTYYIADGSYPGYDFDTPNSSNLVITVRHATAADHGTSTGWNDTFGDGVAEFAATGTPITFSTDYWETYGGGSYNSGQGFRARVTGTADATRGIRLTATGGNIVIDGWEITSDNPAGVADASKQDGIYTTATPNVTVRNCYVHEWKRCGILISGVSGWVIERNFLYHTYSTASSHGQAIQMGPGAVSNVEIRYNTFKDCHGTGTIVALDNVFDDVRIHGNLFWEDEPTAAIGNYSTSQAIGTTSGDTGTNFKIHHNTFVGMDGRSPQPSGGIDMNGTATGNEAYNNVWINCIVTFDAVTHDYNASNLDLGETNDQVISTALFTNYAGGNFTLAGATAAGVALSSTYATDRTGATRGADGTRDRGAWEFVSGGGGDTTPPVISGVSASATGQTTALVTWTTDEASSSSVDVGPTTSYMQPGSPFSGTGGVTSHSVAVTGLSPGTTYHFRVRSSDAASNEATGSDGTFTTDAAAASIVVIRRGAQRATVTP